MAKKEYYIYTDFGFFGKTNQETHCTDEVKFFSWGISFKVDHKTSFGHSQPYIIRLPWSQIKAVAEHNYKKS